MIESICRHLKMMAPQGTYEVVLDMYEMIIICVSRFAQVIDVVVCDEG